MPNDGDSLLYFLAKLYMLAEKVFVAYNEGTEK